MKIKNLVVLSFLLAGYVHAQAPQRAAGVNILGHNVSMQEVAHDMANMGQQIGRNRERARRQDLDRMDVLRESLAENLSAEQRARETQELATLTARDNAEQDMLRRVDQVSLDIVGRASGAVIDVFKDAETRKTEVAKAAVAAREAGKSNNEGSMQRLQYMTDNRGKYVGALALSAVAIFGAYYAFKLSHRYLEKKIDVLPTLVRESSKKGWKASIKNYFKNLFGKEEELVESPLEDVIFEPELDRQIKTLAVMTQSAKAKGLPYRHLLLYGPPGTGKTMSAKRLAAYSGMEYAIMSGADFSQFKEGDDVKELHALFDWAEASDKGLVIFIDEADAFLRKRNEVGERWARLLDAFLTRTGTSSQHFMLVFATNHPEVLDPAVLSRIHKKYFVALPGLAERERMIDLYLKKYIVDDQRTIKQEDEMIEVRLSLDTDINQELIHATAASLEGFSGRQIEQMISEMRDMSYLERFTLTKSLFNDCVHEALQQKKEKQQFFDKSPPVAQLNSAAAVA